MLVEDARARAAGEQAATAAARLARSDEACAALHTQAAAEVARIDGAVTQRVAPLVAELVERVLGQAGSTASS